MDYKNKSKQLEMNTIFFGLVWYIRNSILVNCYYNHHKVRSTSITDTHETYLAKFVGSLLDSIEFLQNFVELNFHRESFSYFYAANYTPTVLC